MDITLCKGGECPFKTTCYRYTAKPNPHRQSYFARAPYTTKKNGQHSCEYYAPTEEGELYIDFKGETNGG